MRAGPRPGWSVRARIAAGLVLVAAMLLPVTAMALLGFGAVLREMDRMAGVEATQLRAAGQAEALLARVEAERRRYARQKDGDALSHARAGVDRAIGVCRGAMKAADGERKAFSNVARLLARYRDALGAEGGAAASAPDLARRAEHELDKIADRIWSRLEEDRREVTRVSQRWMRNLISAFLVTLVVVAALVAWLPRRLAEPFARLRALVRRVERDDAERVDPSAFPDDETRRLARSLLAALAGGRETRELQRDRIRFLEHRFQVFLRRVEDALLVVNRERRIAAASRSVAHLLGAQPGSLEGDRVEEWFPGDELGRLLDRVLGGEEDEAEQSLTAQTASGKTVPVQAEVEVIRDEDQRACQCLIFLRRAQQP